MGRWIHLDTSFRSYVNPESLHCEACGKMIPKEAWIAEKGNKNFSFCNQDCENMYDYMKTRMKKKVP